ncbi:MAG: putative glycosyltransferase EpsH [Parcubacteria group bacterium ADurb.Bin159]|nr:MAG: putative glycosyltransferase EpsH [Parcubacteria group bacterium ADurb.Bin159]
MENKNPKISIIIPVYNREKTLKECLNSVLNQTYQDYEVILVDNNSTDKTKEIIQEFQKKDKRVKYLFEVKKGAAAARYKGEINAKGEIILMTDSDCIVPYNWVEEMIEPIIKNKAVAVQGLKKPAKTKINYWTEHLAEEGRRYFMERLKDNKVGMLDTANFAIKRDILKKIGYTNPAFYMVNDTELDVRLKIKGYSIYFKPFEVKHQYVDNSLDMFKKIFLRGFWNAKILKKYKAKKEILFIPNAIDHLHYFIGIGCELVTGNKNFKYNFISGFLWRIGSLCGYITLDDINN